MPAVESVMLSLGTPAPAFALRDVMSGMMINLDTFANKQALLVMFICPHCPFVKYVNQ
jgi:peroxiredoxin